MQFQLLLDKMITNFKCQRIAKKDKLKNKSKNKTVGRNVGLEKALPGHFTKPMCTNTSHCN